MLSIIAVIGKNRELGCDNKLLWKLPKDMKRFQELTKGHSVIMGRKTLESIGRLLPGRFNIVVTRKKDYHCPGCFGQDCNCIIANSFEDALAKAGHDEAKEVFVIGGAEIYKLALPHADKLYLTLVDDTPKADVYFPEYKEFTKIIHEEEFEDSGFKGKYLELSKN